MEKNMILSEYKTSFVLFGKVLLRRQSASYTSMTPHGTKLLNLIGQLPTNDLLQGSLRGVSSGAAVWLLHVLHQLAKRISPASAHLAVVLGSLPGSAFTRP